MIRSIVLVVMSVPALLLLPSCRQAPQDTGSSRHPEGLESFHYVQLRMGVDVHLELWAASADQARQAARAAFARVAAIDRTLSDYRADSETRRLCARAGQGPVPVSTELMEVLLVAQSLHERTAGAFDVTIGPLTKTWRRARRDGRRPTAEEVAGAKELVGFAGVTLDVRAGTVSLARPGMQLDFGAIGKGYACDAALATLEEHGVLCALCMAGGDIVASAAPPGEEGWRVELPGGEIEWLLAHGALSVSGDAVQYVEADGVRYSHVLLPATGDGVTSGVQAIVRARRGVLSDPLATCGTLLDEQEFRSLLAGFPGVEGGLR